jgi:hypothetical protein
MTGLAHAAGVNLDLMTPLEFRSGASLTDEERKRQGASELGALMRR